MGRQKWISIGLDTKSCLLQSQLLLPTLHKTYFSFPHFQVCLRQEYDHRQTCSAESSIFYFYLPQPCKNKYTNLLENIAENLLTHLLQT